MRRRSRLTAGQHRTELDRQPTQFLTALPVCATGCLPMCHARQALCLLDVWNAQNVSGKLNRIRVWGWQHAVPAGVRTMHQPRFWTQEAPLLTELLTDGNAEGATLTRMSFQPPVFFLHSPLEYGGFQVFGHGFLGQQTEQPIVAGLLHVHLVVSSADCTQHARAVLPGHAERFAPYCVRRTVVHHDGLVARAQRVQGATYLERMVMAVDQSADLCGRHGNQAYPDRGHKKSAAWPAALFSRLVVLLSWNSWIDGWLRALP
jgi:hypothetical protein